MNLAVSELGKHRIRRVVPWFVLPIILVAYSAMVLHLRPANFFGYFQDDTIYFSSAKAMASGQGYILPSLPGTPRATKYPILLPWLQSWIWKLNPSFPANLRFAIALNLGFGFLFILLAHNFIRKFKGLSDNEVLFLTAFCALHPVAVFFSVNLMSDMPFAALVLAALTLADRSWRKDTSWLGFAIAGLASCLVVLMRLAGLPIVAGIALALLIRYSWRGALPFAAGFSPCLLILGKTWFAASTAPIPFHNGLLPGWTQTWLYYTSYTGFRGLEGHFGVLFFNQVLYFIFAIPDYFVGPLSRSNLILWLVSAGLILLLLLLAFRSGDQLSLSNPLRYAGIFYVLFLFLWDYPAWDRFLLPFLPFMAGALWNGLRLSMIALRDSLATQQGVLGRTSVRCLSLALAVFVGAILWNFTVSSRSSTRILSLKRQEFMNGRIEAYDWIRKNTARDSRIIASEDAYLYLYTDRLSVNLTALPPADLYDNKRLQFDLDHLADPAVAVNASYWLTYDDDTQRGLNGFKPEMIARMRELESRFPLVFRSSNGGVRIYDLRCLRKIADADCDTTRPIQPAAISLQGPA
jgi:hypothetical protein